MIEDLSYSGISDFIQGEEIKGADFLNEIAERKEVVCNKIDELENELNALKAERSNLIIGANHVLKHLKKHIPLVVQRGGYIVVVTDKNISIERNVI